MLNGQKPVWEYIFTCIMKSGQNRRNVHLSGGAVHDEHPNNWVEQNVVSKLLEEWKETKCW